MRTLLACALALTACGAEADPERLGTAQQASTVVKYAPSDGLEPTAEHWTYAGEAGHAGSGWLVVFLHGVGGTPAGYKTFLEHANGLGFHVIGLSYWDTKDYGTSRIEDICNPLPQGKSACWGNVRRAMFDGSSVPNVPDLDVPAGTSIKERLEDLFTQLPDAEWGQFKQLSSDLPKWSKIILAGHSMGAGNAAWIAQRRPVARLVMMSQPQDYVPSGAPADWIDDGFSPLTPADIYGLAHNADTVALFSRVWANWGTFGITTDFCIDPLCLNFTCSPSTQYCDAHRLWSKATVANGSEAHNIVAQDDGRYGEAWEYMLTHDL